MIISHNNESIAYTGRWHVGEDAAICTAAGSYFEVGFEGETVCFHFSVCDPAKDVAHLYLSVDGGALIESAVVPFVRVCAAPGRHTVRVTLKSVSEFYDRWHAPEARVALVGAEAQGFFALPEDTRPIIEFVGDSITEGVMVDALPHPIYDHYCKDRVFEDDSTVTYARLTADALNMRPYIMGYGAVGVCKGGCGNMPRAAEAYPFCYEGVPMPAYEPSIIVLGHGTNDGGAPAEEFHARYVEMLELLAKTHPEAKLVALSPFFGKMDEKVERAVKAYNEAHGRPVTCILSTGWISPTPIHPGRDGHKAVARELSRRLLDLLSST